jgi:hypothetical protein
VYWTLAIHYLNKEKTSTGILSTDIPIKIIHSESMLIKDCVCINPELGIVCRVSFDDVQAVIRSVEVDRHVRVASCFTTTSYYMELQGNYDV